MRSPDLVRLAPCSRVLDAYNNAVHAGLYASQANLAMTMDLGVRVEWQAWDGGDAPNVAA